MTNGFRFDAAAAMEQMEHVTALNLMVGRRSLYGLVCINEDHASSHGGEVVSVQVPLTDTDGIRVAIDKAIAAAMDVNEGCDESITCIYVPITMGISMDDIALLIGVPTEEEVENFDDGLDGA